jgi:hypothetical protein
MLKNKTYEFQPILKTTGIIMFFTGGMVDLIFFLKLKELASITLLIITSASLIFIISGIIMFFVYSVKVTLTENEIIWSRPGNKKKISYNEVKDIIPKPASLVVKTGDREIKISKQIENYDELYNLIKKYTPAVSSMAKFPLKIKTSIANKIGYAVLGLFLIILATYIFYSPIWQKSDKLLITGFLVILIMGSIAIFYFFILKQPLFYVFDEKIIKVKTLVRTHLYHIDIKNIHLEKSISTRWGVDIANYLLHIDFNDGKRLTIDGKNIVYPLEELSILMKNHYKN